MELTAACSAAAGNDTATSKQDIQHVGGRCPFVPQSASSSAPTSAALFVRVSFDYASIAVPVEVRLLLNNAVAYRWANVSRAQSFAVTAPYPTDGSTDRWRAQVLKYEQMDVGKWVDSASGRSGCRGLVSRFLHSRRWVLSMPASHCFKFSSFVSNMVPLNSPKPGPRQYGFVRCAGSRHDQSPVSGRLGGVKGKMEKPKKSRNTVLETPHIVI